MWRKSNKLALRLELSTSSDAVGGAPAHVAIALQYSYKNTVPPPTNAATNKTHHTLYTIVVLSLGAVQA